MIINFEMVKNTVKDWCSSNIAIWEKEFDVDIVDDKSDCFSIDFFTKFCGCRIIVSNSQHNPYRYVLLDVLGKSMKTIYTWYDDAETSLDTIIEELNKGIQFCSSYKV